MKRSIPLQQLALLKKIMAYTTSQSDSEALTAIRKANQILSDHGYTWNDFFDRTVNASFDVEASTEMPLEEQIRRAFDEIRGNAHGTFGEFIDDIEKQFKESGYLTVAQRKPLFDAVKRHRERRRRDE